MNVWTAMFESHAGRITFMKFCDTIVVFCSKNDENNSIEFHVKIQVSHEQGKPQKAWLDMSE